MAVPQQLADKLEFPVIAAPMFLVSGPDLVCACCLNGIGGSFPALNQRTTAGYEEWLTQIETELDGTTHAPFGINLIVHKTNPRLEADLKVTVDHKVPFVITSLGAVSDVVDAVHSYGGLVFHDVTNMRHAEKAIQAGADGLILVSAGAGGHAGTLHPFAFISEIKNTFDTCVIQSGAISTGEQVLAARAAGADLAYIGTRFIATSESMADQEYKDMVVSARSEDIVYTPKVSGIPANFIRQSLEQNGISLDDIDSPDIDLGRELIDEAKAWKTIWSAGHGAGNINNIPSTAELCNTLKREYHDQLHTLNATANGA